MVGTFTLYPAIDIRGGRCVRLVQGDYDRETVYGEPAAMASRWEEEGASFLHVVDLDGARAGEPVNLKAVAEILEAVSIPIQLGGGLRRREDLERVLDLGVTRAILGTVAAENPGELRNIVSGMEESVAIGVDLRNGEPQVRGWERPGSFTLASLLVELENIGLGRIIHTEIARDGMLSGYDIDALRNVATSTTMKVIASGGVSSLADILAIKEMMPLGVDGAILGKALYSGDMVLREALILQEVG